MFELLLSVPAALLASYIGVTYITGNNFEIVEVRVPETLIEKGYSEAFIAEKIEARLDQLEHSSDASMLIKLRDSQIVETGGVFTSFFEGMSKAFHEFEEVRVTSAYIGLLPNAVTIEVIAPKENQLSLTIKHTAPYIGDDFEEITVNGSSGDLEDIINRGVDEFLHQNYPLEYFDVVLQRSIQRAQAAESQISLQDRKLLRELVSEMLVQTPPTDLYNLYIDMAIVELIEGEFEEASVRSRQAATYIGEKDPRMIFSSTIDAFAAELAGDLQRAELIHSKNIENFPELSVGYMSYGSFQQRAGRIDEAEKNYAAGLRLTPDNPRYLALLAQIKLSKRDYLGAAKILKDANFRDPEDELIKSNLKLAQAMLDPTLAAFHDKYSTKQRSMCLSNLMCILTQDKIKTLTSLD